ncbi:MAG: DUF3783 domain-containing protein [Clostridiaceae bacterium]|nr:DUF3783 domain-containing protein [Clostridiaceae bacterium]
MIDKKEKTEISGNLTDQAIQTSKPVFDTPFGLIVFFPETEDFEDSEDSDKNKKSCFINFLNSEKIPFYLIKNEDFSLTISQILVHLEKTNKQGNERSPISKGYQHKKQQTDNILFFSGFSRDQVENFLEKIRNEKYPRFPLKAVTTKNNYHFTFDKLINELTQDRIVISHVINLRKRINSLTKHLTNNKTLNPEQKTLLQKEIDQAENLLRDVDTNFDLELFRIQIKKFNYLLAKLKHKYPSEKTQLESMD